MRACSKWRRAGSQLKEGLDGLEKGASGLRSGLWKFYNEGLVPLEENMSGIQLALDRKDAMLKLAAEYTSFSGEPKTTVGSVRFIVTTDSIYVPSVTPEPVIPADAETEPGFLNGHGIGLKICLAADRCSNTLSAPTVCRGAVFMV